MSTDLAYAIVTWTVVLLLAAVLLMAFANRRAVDLEPPVSRGNTLRLRADRVVGLYFAIPMLAMTRFAFQRTPVVLLTPTTCSTTGR